MLALLSGRILEDEVGDIPPNGDMSEFIALCSGAMCDREAGACEEEIDSPDGLQGPFEPDEEDDGSWDPHVAFDAAIEAVQVDARPSGPIVERAHEHDGGAGSDPGAKLASDTQIPQFAPSPVRRDHFLPRPYRSGFACP
jgi:hypothetical protein